MNFSVGSDCSWSVWVLNPRLNLNEHSGDYFPVAQKFLSSATSIINILGTTNKKI